MLKESAVTEGKKSAFWSICSNFSLSTPKGDLGK